MNRFTYERPRETAHAFALLARQTDAKWISGGTNLVDLMKLGVEHPPMLVDTGALNLRELAFDDNALRIGAGMRMSEVIGDERVAREFPVLVQALAAGASPQLRNMASIGGNLMQRTRCPYFRDLATPCNKRTPGTGCSAIGGLTRRHAILGTSDACIAVHPSDLAVALVAADARVHTASANGSMEIPIEQFYVLPGERPDIETVLRAEELIVAVSVPRSGLMRRSLYKKARDRASYDFALVSAAVAVELRDHAIADVRIALGGVATRPWRAHRAEEVLRGQRPSLDAFGEAASAELAQARTYAGNEFKIPLASRLLVRALSEAAELR
jgi:xanthine dehydrogenase YagS FAD-binding subunit